MFPRDYYNIVKTKDNKFVAMGNLEEKFQDNFKKVFFKEIQKPEKFQSNCQEKLNTDDLSIDYISKELLSHNRDDIFKMVILKLN